MRASRPAAEAEVVLAFLRGEVESPRFGGAVRDALDHVGGVGLILYPNLDSTRDNLLRAQALGAARGWRTGEGLFAGFPAEVSWTYGIFDEQELQAIRYINYSYWVALSGGSRRPADVMPTLAAGTVPPWLADMETDWCLDLATELATASSVGDLLVLTTPQRDDLVLLEGHARLTALFMGDLISRTEVRGYIGVSPDATSWELF